jgi:hypothetical protein
LEQLMPQKNGSGLALLCRVFSSCLLALYSLSQPGATDLMRAYTLSAAAYTSQVRFKERLPQRLPPRLSLRKRVAAERLYEAWQLETQIEEM